MKECLRLITERRSITFFDPTKEVPEKMSTFGIHRLGWLMAKT